MQAKGGRLAGERAFTLRACRHQARPQQFGSIDRWVYAS
jgi:hypothetical protein